MFINDHFKYPNDAIAASIQYIFGKNGQTIEISEGFKGQGFGIFNHVTEMIFNIALINIDLGGILYPKNYFLNSTFYDQELFLKSTNNSEQFWESAFIIIDNKILRQSSKIYDYTRYLIDDINYDSNYLLEKIRLSFLIHFPIFKNI